MNFSEMEQLLLIWSVLMLASAGMLFWAFGP